jgi:PEP-CTERM motif
LINVSSDNAANGGAMGRFQRDPGAIIMSTNTALEVDTILHVETAGLYTFGFDVSDGAELTIAGGQFITTLGDALITNLGQSLTLEATDRTNLSLGLIDLAAGDYPLEFITFNHLDALSAELFVAPGFVELFDREAFSLLTRTSRRIDYDRAAGLRLVPEPSTVALGLACLVCFAAFGFRRSNFSRLQPQTFF